MKRVLTVFAGSLLLAGLAAAQETRATIQGVVKDPQGGVVAAAAVVVTNTDTNMSVNLKSDQTGRYQAPLLLPGNYVVSAEAPGFKKSVRAGITLALTDVREVELVLQVGAITESVTVTSEAPIIDATRTDSGRVIDERSVQDLPVMANTVFTMIRYSAGVQGGGPPILLGPHSTQGGSDYNNGAGVGGNAWTIDGAVNDGNARNTANLPSVEAVAETKVLSTTFDGSFGHSTGLGVAVSTKTGTNQFHGSASENYWNQRWQGANLFTKKNFYSNIAAANAAGNPTRAAQLAAQPIQPAGHSNLWGLNVTGPVWIPKIFNGRNKVFFSFNYNGEKDAKPEESSTYNRVVPTAANKKGDFSDLLNVATTPQQFQLYDPLSVKVDPARAGHYIRTPLAGNILPGQYINMGKKFYDGYAKYWPDPNNWFDKSTIPNLNPFLAITAPYNWTFGQYGGRMDVNLGSKMRMFGRYTQNHFVEFRGDWTIDILPGLNNQNSAGSGVTRDDQNGVLDWVYTLNASTIMHASFSVSNWVSLASVGATPFQFKPSDVGLPTYMDAKCALTQCYLPLMQINGYAQNGISGIPNPVYNRFNTENFDLYHNHGKHSLRFGLDIRQQIRSIHAGNNDGSYGFGNTYFRQCDDACANGQYTAGTIGLSWASFMMGLPNGYTPSGGSAIGAINISGNDSSYVKNPYYAWFAQDSWRVTPKLTLTLALRAEFEQGAQERYNRLIIDYDKNMALPISSLAEAAYAKSPIPELPASQFKVLGGAVYAGASGAPSRAWKSQLMWLPRVGFGYQVNPKTVVRGGYGVYYDTLNVNAISYQGSQTGFSRGTNTTVTNDNGVTWLAGDPANGVSPLNDPFPVRASQGGTRFDAPLRDALGNMALVGSGFTYTPDRHPRQQRWRVAVERQIGEANVVEAAYEGTYASDMNINASLSGIPSSYYYMGTSRPVNSATGATISCSATVTTGCLQDSNLGTNVTNPFAIANFASLASSNPVVYQDMATKSFYTSATISKANLIRAYSNGNLTIPDPVGKARSHMLAVSFNHRFSKGLTANFAYTGMIQKQATSFFQPWSVFDSANPQVPYWVRGGAVPNRIAATFVYDLPFGKGRQWIHNALASQVVGGWTLAGTYEYSPGGLLGFGSNTYYGDVNQIKISNPTFGQYFNTAGCVASAAAAGPGDTVILPSAPDQTCKQGWEKRSAFTPGTYQMRTFPQNIDGLRGPGYQQWNASLSKNIKLYERVTFQMRLDALNLLNHSFIGGPNTTPTSAQFGQITAGAANLNRFVQIQGHIRW
jgi:hypothetical protein